MSQPHPDQHDHESTDVGRRDRKKLATRRALRNAALQLVAERGMAGVTIEDITELADVAPRTFFNYFNSKEAAVVGADPDRKLQLRANLVSRPAEESPIEALRAVLVDNARKIAEEFDDLGESKESWTQRFCLVRNDPDLLGAYVAHATEIERVMADAIAERLGMDPVEDIYPTLLAATVFAATRVAALYWSAHSGAASLAECTAAAIDALRSGFVDEPTRTLSASNSRRPIAGPAAARNGSTTPTSSPRQTPNPRSRSTGHD